MLAAAGRHRGLAMHMARAAGLVNAEQQDRFARRILDELGTAPRAECPAWTELQGRYRRLAGLAFHCHRPTSEQPGHMVLAHDPAVSASRARARCRGCVWSRHRARCGDGSRRPRHRYGVGGLPRSRLGRHPGPDARPSRLRWSQPARCHAVTAAGLRLPGRGSPARSGWGLAAGRGVGGPSAAGHRPRASRRADSLQSKCSVSTRPAAAPASCSSATGSPSRSTMAAAMASAVAGRTTWRHQRR